MVESLVILSIILTVLGLQDALGELETPRGRSKPEEKTETPLTDFVHRNLKVALANSTRNSSSEMQAVSASPQLPKVTETEVKQNTAAENGVLISKKKFSLNAQS